MKKIVAFLLCLFIIIAIFTSCGYSGTGRDFTPPPDSSSSQITVSSDSSSLPEESLPSEDIQGPEPYLTKPADDNAILLNANILTEMVTLCLDNNATPEEPEFNYFEYLVRCAVEEDEDFKYYGIFPYETGLGYVFPVRKCEAAIYQVFGFDAWNVRENLKNEMRDENTAVIPTEVGWGMNTYYAGDFITASFINDKKQVCCNFEMFAPADINGDPGNISLGMYNMIFDVVHTADAETYLQFSHYEKA